MSGPVHRPRAVLDAWVSSEWRAAPERAALAQQLARCRQVAAERGDWGHTLGGFTRQRREPVYAECFGTVGRLHLQNRAHGLGEEESMILQREARKVGLAAAVHEAVDHTPADAESLGEDRVEVNADDGFAVTSAQPSMVAHGCLCRRPQLIGLAPKIAA
jgi:hypothetical protein